MSAHGMRFRAEGHWDKDDEGDEWIALGGQGGGMYGKSMVLELLKAPAVVGHAPADKGGFLQCCPSSWQDLSTRTEMSREGWAGRGGGVLWSELGLGGMGGNDDPRDCDDWPGRCQGSVRAYQLYPG